MRRTISLQATAGNRWPEGGLGLTKPIGEVTKRPAKPMARTQNARRQAHQLRKHRVSARRLRSTPRIQRHNAGNPEPMLRSEPE
jgi:hypothetical protein